MLTNTYECMAIILRSLRLVANCIRKPIRLIFATFWRICREYIFLHSQGYSPQCESSIMSHSLNPQITLPTRFSTNNGTLIDNIFSKLFNPSASTCAGIHINRLSDHQPCFLFIDIHIVRRSSPKFIQIHNLTPQSLLTVSNDLKEINIYIHNLTNHPPQM